MTHLYSGPTDERQSDDLSMKTSRFRPRYRALTEEEKSLHDVIKNKAAEIEALFNQINHTNNCGREMALAFTKLEESIMWAIKGLTK